MMVWGVKHKAAPKDNRVVLIWWLPLNYQSYNELLTIHFPHWLLCSFLLSGWVENVFTHHVTSLSFRYNFSVNSILSHFRYKAKFSWWMFPFHIHFFLKNTHTTVLIYVSNTQLIKGQSHHVELCNDVFSKKNLLLVTF